MRKILTFITATALALGMGTALGASSDKANTTKAAQAAAKKAPSFLFVVSAKKAQIKKGKDGNTLLVIKKSDLDKVIEFSDRPYRIVKYITGNDLAKDWRKGENSFAADPPNAVLSGANFKPHIVILNGMTTTDDTLTFRVDGRSLLNDGLEGHVVSPVMTVDGSWFADILYKFDTNRSPFFYYRYDGGDWG